MASVASTSGPMPKAGTRPTAPGRCATHSTTSIIQSMPQPITVQHGASKPKGIMTTPRMPIGITTTETTGIAARLAITP